MTDVKKVRLPPGVTVQQRPITGGTVHEFAHERIGRIGRIAFVVDNERRQAQVAVEVGPCDPDDSRWITCFELLTPIVRAHLDAHNIRMPLPSREDVRHTARLYWRFLRAEPGPEMEEFARGLSREDYDRLGQACKQALWVALPAEAPGIRQRLKEVQTIRMT